MSRLFKNYLRDKKLSEASIKAYQTHFQYFVNWLGERKPLQAVLHIDVVNYMAFLRKKGLSEQTINVYLLTIKYYFISTKKKTNPVQNIDINKRKKKVILATLKEEFIEEMYLQSCFESVKYPKQAKVLFGLLCFQGIKSSEVKNITVFNIDLQRATIDIPKTQRSNGRTIKLKAIQLYDLMDYMVTEFKQRVSNTDRLIIGDSKQRNLNDINKLMLKRIQAKYGNHINWQLIRDSVILNWMKHLNIREVQYLCGHKHISSTELYVVEDIEDLKDKVKEFHPM